MNRWNGMKRAALLAMSVLAAAAVAFALVTLVALEGGDVAVLHTRDEHGGIRKTRVWFVERDGSILVESATAERPFFLDVVRDPHVIVELRRGPTDGQPRIVEAQAAIVAEPDGHEEIRRLLERKYGWADRWIAMLADTSASREIRLHPQDHAR